MWLPPWVKPVFMSLGKHFSLTFNQLPTCSLYSFFPWYVLYMYRWPIMFLVLFCVHRAVSVSTELQHFGMCSRYIRPKLTAHLIFSPRTWVSTSTNSSCLSFLSSDQLKLNLPLNVIDTNNPVLANILLVNGFQFAIIYWE